VWNGVVSAPFQQAFPALLSNSTKTLANPHLQRVGHLHIHGNELAGDGRADGAGAAAASRSTRVQPCAAEYAHQIPQVEHMSAAATAASTAVPEV
jgi:hypothetical protein